MSRRSMGLAGAVGLVIALLSTGPILAARQETGELGEQPRFDAKLRTVALGISIVNGRDIGKLDDFTDSIGGRKPATWTIWSQWGNPATRAFPMAAAKGASSRGSTPLIWWEPVIPSDLDDPTYPRHANILAGMHDDYIRAFARDAKQFRKLVLLRFAHEANGGAFPWGAGSFDNTAATFVAAWRHVRDIFTAVGAKNVRWVWSVAKQTCDGGCNPYTEFYPGDAYVDYMGFSSFNWGAQKAEWVPMIQGFQRVTERLREISAKPIIAVETACNPEGGDKPAWIREGYHAVYAALPQIVAIVYLNVDLQSVGHPDWRLTSPPTALDAYAEIAALPQFGGRIAGA